MAFAFGVILTSEGTVGVRGPTMPKKSAAKPAKKPPKKSAAKPKPKKSSKKKPTLSEAPVATPVVEELIKRWISEEFPDEQVLLADGFDEALIGLGRAFTEPLVAVYDLEKCLNILMARDGMSAEEAQEFFDFNVIGAYVGDQTPMFVTTFNPERHGHHVH